MYYKINRHVEFLGLDRLGYLGLGEEDLHGREGEAKAINLSGHPFDFFNFKHWEM